MAQDAPADAIAAVISDQLANFNERDANAAFEHASPTIQGIFGNAANFGMMVQRGYPMVWTNGSTRFLDLEMRRGAWFQTVQIEDAQGVFHLLEYKMIETPDGWRIDGVRILPNPDLGV
ncbi:DUF4864 domain-containing protein [Histidinibacterium lentulum]|uniref:DUF4864 domain-containing protein n=2 Tax=Histidinibacterium lentulum TaxID=2480588 RepID=A0A3N2R8S2_9RHOB|nr:DUF4864 domain-containing protein [Histidinibacterium lentulum]